MLQPTRTKYRKTHRGTMKGCAQKGNFIAFGDFGLQALEPHWITSAQIEAARVAITHAIKRGGKVWIRMFPDKSATKKPAEGGVELNLAKEAMRLAAHKLPIKTRFLSRDEQVVG